MKPRERRGLCGEGGGDGVQGKDIVRQTTSRRRSTEGNRGRWRKKIKRGTRGKTDRSEGNVWWDGCGYLFCGEERNYFMGVDSDAVGNSGRMRPTPPPTLIGKGAHPFTIPGVRDSNHLTRYLFAFPRDHRDSFISPKERGIPSSACSVPRPGTRFLACWIENGGL